MGEHSPGLAQDRLFIVPGNRAVEPRPDSVIMRTLIDTINDQKTVNQLLANDSDRGFISGRFDSYASFVAEYFAPHLGLDSKHCFYLRHIREVGQSITTLGLNTALLSLSGRDTNLILLEERKARKAPEATRDADLRIAIMPHPLNWPKEFGRADVEPML